MRAGKERRWMAAAALLSAPPDRGEQCSVNASTAPTLQDITSASTAPPLHHITSASGEQGAGSQPLRRERKSPLSGGRRRALSRFEQFVAVAAMVPRRAALGTLSGACTNEQLATIATATKVEVAPTPEIATEIGTALATASARAAAAQTAALEAPIGHLALSTDHVVTLMTEIGAGGFGTVYSARSSRRPDTLIAVKMVGHGGDPEAISDIAREAAAHERLFSTEHASNRLLVQLFHQHQEAVRSLLLLELVSDHVELEDFVDQSHHSRLSEAVAMPLAGLLTEAVARCHQMRVAHLDIQPRNVLVAANGSSLKLIDYGASTLLGPSVAVPPPTVAAALFDAVMPARPATLAVEGDGWVTDQGGCPNYRAPERHLADHALVGEDVRFFAEAADVYSLGCTFFYMLTGRDAFDFEAEEESHDDLLDQIEGGEVHSYLAVAHILVCRPRRRCQATCVRRPRPPSSPTHDPC